MSIAVTPSPASQVRATRYLDPQATPEQISRRTGIDLTEVKSILGRDPKRRIKSVAR